MAAPRGPPAYLFDNPLLAPLDRSLLIRFEWCALAHGPASCERLRLVARPPRCASRALSPRGVGGPVLRRRRSRRHASAALGFQWAPGRPREGQHSDRAPARIRVSVWRWMGQRPAAAFARGMHTRRGLSLTGAARTRTPPPRPYRAAKEDPARRQPRFEKLDWQHRSFRPLCPLALWTPSVARGASTQRPPVFAALTPAQYRGRKPRGLAFCAAGAPGPLRPSSHACSAHACRSRANWRRIGGPGASAHGRRRAARRHYRERACAHRSGLEPTP